MPTLVNRLFVALGLCGAAIMIVALLMRIPPMTGEVMPVFRYCLTLATACIAAFQAVFALTNMDSTGITYEGRVTSIMPVALAVCGLTLIARWMPELLYIAIGWLLLHLPGAFVGLTEPTSNLKQTIQRQQNMEDRRIGVEWELKQLGNRVALLQQLTRTGGADPQAMKKLLTTGNSLEKYYSDTQKQLEIFLQQVEDDAQRGEAQTLLSSLQSMNISKE